MTHLPFTRAARTLALVGALTIAASACGSSSGASSPSSTVTEVAGGGGGGGSGSTIDVTLKNYSITVKSSGTVAPGVYTFHVSNQGPLSHNLTVNGPGVTTMATPTFSPGSTENLTVTLKNGTYDLYCSVPGHKQLGMDTHLTVGSGGAAGGGGSTKSGGSSGGSTASGGGWA